MVENLLTLGMWKIQRGITKAAGVIKESETKGNRIKKCGAKA